MIKEIIKITNRALDLSNLDAHHLSIQLSLDGFSFCISHKTNNELVHFATYEWNQQGISPQEHVSLVQEVFEQVEILNAKFTSVSVSHLNNLVSHVPLPLFDEKKSSEYLKYSVKLLENDFISTDTLENVELVSVYVPFVNINNFLVDQYHSFVYKHSSTILIEKLTNQFKNEEGDFCFVNVSNTNYELIVLKNKRFELYNYFSYSSKEDFIYYILFTAEQLHLNPETLRLVLMGDIEKESELYKMAYDYIRNVSFYQPIIKHALLSNNSNHSNFSLLNHF